MALPNPIRSENPDAPHDLGERALARRFGAYAATRDLRSAHELVRPLAGRLEAWVLSRYGTAIGGRAGAEAIALQALDNALLKAHQFDPEKGTLWPWLSRIAANLAVDELTEARRMLTRVGDDDLGAAAVPDGSEAEQQHARIAQVREALGRLPKRARILLKSHGRVSVERLAARFQCGKPHVYNLRCRAMRELREELRRRSAT